KHHPALRLPFAAHAALGSTGTRPGVATGGSGTRTSGSRTSGTRTSGTEASGTRTPASSKSTTPLQSRLQPCPGWQASTRGAARDGADLRFTVDTTKWWTHTFDSNFQKDVTAEGV